MSTLTMTQEQAFEWIKRAMELGKYDTARGILEDMIIARIQEENAKETRSV
jgi:hypothetical protein